MKRREFITLLGGALAKHAIPANAQEPVRVRTVGALIGFASDAGAKARTQAFEQSLERQGWSIGHNLRIEYGYAEGDSARMQAFAAGWTSCAIKAANSCARIEHLTVASGIPTICATSLTDLP
jgi:putative ABC transport system substrate-binding protein